MEIIRTIPQLAMLKSGVTADMNMVNLLYLTIEATSLKWVAEKMIVITAVIPLPPAVEKRRRRKQKDSLASLILPHHLPIVRWHLVVIQYGENLKRTPTHVRKAVIKPMRPFWVLAPQQLQLPCNKAIRMGKASHGLTHRVSQSLTKSTPQTVGRTLTVGMATITVPTLMAGNLLLIMITRASTRC